MKKNERTLLSEIFKYLISLVVVLVIGAALIRFQGGNAGVAFRAIIEGAFGGRIMLGNTLRWITPCLLTGLSATIAFKSGIWNLGIGGQLYAGAFATTLAGLYFNLPPTIFPIVCLLIGGVFGLVFAIIPAFLKLYLNISEMISTLLLNYVGALVTEYLTKIVKGISASDNSKAMATPSINEVASLPRLIDKTNAHAGIFIAIVLIIVVHLVYRHTIVGYELKQVGANQRFARVGGVNTTRIYLSIFIISGFLAGLAGGVEVLGVYRKFTPNFAANIGWDGIMIATIGHNSPLGVGIVGTLWVTLKAGAMHMERVTSSSRLTIEVLQALFVLFATIDIRKHIGFIGKAVKERSRVC